MSEHRSEERARSGAISDERSREEPSNMSGRAWNDGGFIESGDSPAEVRDVLHADPTSKAWLFLPRQETDALDRAAQYLGIDALAVEDVLGEREPMKVDWIDSTLIAVLRWVSFDLDAGELTVLPISVLASPRAVIVLTDEQHHAQLCATLNKQRKAILAVGVPAALHAVIDTVVDGITDVLQMMEDAVDNLSDALFDDRPLSKSEQLYAFRVRRSLAHLRRVTTPMRDIASNLANAAGRAAAEYRPDDPTSTDAAEELFGRRSIREFSDVADHAEHAAQSADALRDVISSMYETNLALADVHLNTVMKKLTGWAAIIAVPTLITGFMGMNVPYPGFQSETGFLIAATVMIAVVVTLFVTLRRRDWI